MTHTPSPTNGTEAGHEDELERIYRTAPVGLCLLDAELRYVRVNEWLAEIHGKPVAEHIGRRVRDVVPEIASVLEPVLRKVIETRKSQTNLEVYAPTVAEDGDKRYWLTNCYPFFSDDGAIQGVRVHVPEVTERRRLERILEERVRERTAKLREVNARLRKEIAERRQAQQALEQTEQRLRQLLETTKVVPWEANAQWQFTYVGPQAIELLGYPLERWYEDDFWTDQIHPEDRERTIEDCRDYSTRYEHYELEYRMIRADGESVWVRDFVSAVFKDGELDGLRGFIIDTTEPKRAEYELKLSQERYQDLYDNAPDMFCSTETATGKIKQCNQTLASKTGYRKEEIIGRHFMEMCHPDGVKATERVFQLFKETGRVRNAELQLRRKDGTAVHVSANVSAIRDKNGKILSSRAVFRDISERKWVEKALRQSEAALRKSEAELRRLTGKLLYAQEEERRRLARELHDDLSQRLAALAIEAGKLEQELSFSTDSIDRRFTRIKQEVRDLSTDVHRMAHQLHPSILDDLGLIDAIETECNRVAERESLAISFFPEDVPLTLPKDVALCLYRITQESLHNIAKHSQAPSAAVSLGRDASGVVLSIQDSGVGFEPAKIKERAGLGLASMQERVRLIQGTLSIRSQPGQGTTIQVRAPLTRENEDAKSTRAVGG